MKLYNNNWLIPTIIFSGLVFLISIVLFLLSSKFYNLSILILAISLFLLTFIKQKEETSEIITTRHNALLAVFILIFSTFISFAFVNIFTNTLEVSGLALLKLTVFYLVFYNILLNYKLLNLKYNRHLGFTKNTMVAYVFVSIVVLFVVIYQVYMSL